MTTNIGMTTTRPYLLRAFYEWIVDNHLTPYIVVDATADMVQVPSQYVDDEGKIILNISPTAVQSLALENSFIEFNARFAGHAMHVYVPIEAVKAIYAKENGRGLVFTEDESDTTTTDSGNVSEPPPKKPPTKKGKPSLKVIK